MHVVPRWLTDRRNWTDRGASVLLWLTAVIISGVFVWIVGDVVWHGVGQINLAFFLQPPAQSGRAGGIFPVLISTLWILVVALAVAVPLGIGTAVWIAEFTRRDGPWAVLVGRSLDILAAVPSIVFGLFGNVLFCNLLGLGYSILAGGLTLSCMVLPILIRTLESGLRSVPDDYRLAAAALGISNTRCTVSILLPSAAPALAVGLVLGIGRVLAETAALLFTSGYVDRMPRSLLDSGRSLSIHIYDLSMNVPGGEANAYATALVLVLLLLVINGAAVGLADRWPGRAAPGVR